MPYSSDTQRRYFNWKAKTDPKWKKLADEYNKASKGMSLPEKTPEKTPEKKSSIKKMGK